MKTLMYFLLFLLFGTSVYSQEKKTTSKYYTWVELMNNDKSGIGYLLDVDDRGITHLQKRYFKKWQHGEDQLSLNIPFENIRNLKFRRKNKSLNGMLYGGLIGGTAVGLLALASNTGCSGKGFCIDFSDPAMFTFGFILGAIPGALIGSIIGSEKVSIPINGSYDNFQKQKARIRNYILDH